MISALACLLAGLVKMGENIGSGADIAMPQKVGDIGKRHIVAEVEFVFLGAVHSINPFFL